jgi:AraC-like DNA-binding protein
MSADWIYRERPPPAALAGQIRRVWSETVGERADDPAARVLPDGCIDLVWIAERPPFVAGPATGPVFTAARPGSTTVGLRLQPGLAANLLGVAAHELLNAELPLAELWGRAWSEQLTWDAEAPAEERIAGLQRLVQQRLERAGPGDLLVAAAARWLTRHPDAGLGRLYELSGLSDRQLRRRFEGAVGYSPKTYQRIVRFQRWLRLARASPPVARSLSDLAAAAGYADQAHLTREATRLAGLPPAALLAGRGSAAGPLDTAGRERASRPTRSARAR